MSDDSLPPFLATSPPPVAPPSSARIRALYASTSTQRSANPTGYSANSQWWAGVIEETLRTGWVNGEDGDRLVVRVDESLLARFEDEQGRRPKGIGGVVENLATTAPPILHPLPHFQSSLTPLHAPASLTSRFIGRPLWWAVSQLNPFGSSGEKMEKEETLWARYGKGKEYVHMPLLEQSAAAFTAHIAKNPILSYTASIFDLESFRKEYGQACFPISTSKKLPAGRHELSSRDIEILIKWLTRDCGELVSDGTIIKVLKADQSPADHPISEADRGVISVLNAQRRVEKQVLGIEAQIAQSHEKAKKHLASGQKNIALSYLRSKKQLEDLLAKRVASAEQLGAVIRSIDQARGDAEIMAAYETSTSTLRSVLSDPSLSPDRIAETTDALADAMADQEEIDQAVRIGGELAMGSRRVVEVDEDELAAELADLVEEEKAEQEREREREQARAKEREEAKRSAESATKQADVERKLASASASASKASSSSSSTEPAFVQQEKPEIRSKIATGSSEKVEDEARRKQVYDDAQERKEAERRRSEEEVLRKIERRIAAE
ncbi:charged multivesicular body protein 7 [Kwoniella heveanensis CBS 569]|nr:charged multivesicular body protein 7 [Kwoniella heveanensis CBS 569]